MPIEVNSSASVCSKCGKAYSRRKGFFPVSYAILHKGIGYVPVCKECIDTMYNGYLAQCNNAPDAVRQMCRKLDLYWSESVYKMVERKSTTRSVMTQYIAKINTITYAGKSYDDTLSEEGTLWDFRKDNSKEDSGDVCINNSEETSDPDDEETPQEVIDFWGSGYTSKMYKELEQRRRYWMSRLPDNVEIDVGTEALIRQICPLELDINRDRARGKAVDKSVNALNNLLGSANLKPTQKKDDSDSSMDGTPFGVWIRKWENQKPIPEPDPELQDVDKIVKYIEVWFKGHLSKMLNIKSSYSKLYEETMNKIRVSRPEYEEEDDETLFNNIFANSEEGSESNNADGGDS